jgi:hypothetical protein
LGSAEAASSTEMRGATTARSDSTALMPSRRLGRDTVDARTERRSECGEVHIERRDGRGYLFAEGVNLVEPSLMGSVHERHVVQCFRVLQELRGDGHARKIAENRHIVRACELHYGSVRGSR